MSNFTPSFANLADKRYPTLDERQQGFECGPADRQLFHGLFHRIEAELSAVIDAAGIIQTDTDLTQVLQAIQALIEAATGGGDPENYLLVSQARARLPIFPEIQNVDGRIVITAPATGTVRLPGGVTFLHRGIFPITTSQTDFATTASKTYHLRWVNGTGFVLRDLADVAYNPGALAETNITFDSGYDDMLIARVITNTSNIATITNLANKVSLLAAGEELAAKGALPEFQHQDAVRPSQISQYTSVPVNFARTPTAFLTALNDVATSYAEINIGVRTLNRYNVAVWGQGDLDIWTGWGARA